MLAVTAPSTGAMVVFESALKRIIGVVRSIPRLPVILVVYIAIVGFVYKKMMRDFLGIGTKRVRILGKVTVALTKEEEILSASVVDPSAITDTFDSVGGLADVKQVLTESVIWPYQHPELFEREGLGDSALPTGVLLHGPPGTGKTLLARALAKELGCFFIEVSAELLFSKYVGESEKLAAAVFSLAHKLQNCVIFVDEIDSLLAQRTESSDTAVFNHTKTLFMTKWDGLTSQERKPGEARHRILVLGATNRAQVLDEAITRRLPVRLLVPLPDRTARKAILEIQFKNLGFNAAPLEACDIVTSTNSSSPKRHAGDGLIDQIAAETQNYSGSDLRELCKAAVAVSVRDTIHAMKQQIATDSAKPSGGKPAPPLTPTSSGSNNVDAAASRTLHWRHFEEACKRVRPSGAPANDEATREVLRMLASRGRR